MTMVLGRKLPRVQEGKLVKTHPDPIPGMKQRRFGGSEAPRPKWGDCWATAVASFAGLGVPERNELHRRILISDDRVSKSGRDPKEGGNWWNVTLRFLWEHDLPSLGHVWTDPDPEVVYIASGPSPRGIEHSMLAFGDGRIFSDPHPDSTGLTEITSWIWWWTA